MGNQARWILSAWYCSITQVFVSRWEESTITSICWSYRSYTARSRRCECSFSQLSSSKATPIIVWRRIARNSLWYHHLWSSDQMFHCVDLPDRYAVDRHTNSSNEWDATLLHRWWEATITWSIEVSIEREVPEQTSDRWWHASTQLCCASLWGSKSWWTRSICVISTLLSI